MPFPSSSVPSRRDFFQGTSAVVVSAFAGFHAPLLSQETKAMERIQRSEKPLTLETPLSALQTRITSKDLFYVRNHFPVPTLKADTWRLRISGAVERELEWTLDDLRKLPSKSLLMTMECAGNSRSALVPAVRGVPWGNGAVGTIEWTGVPLVQLLERAGLKANAVDVVLEGADQGEIASDPKSPGPIHFARSLPLAKAKQADVVLAYLMGDGDLPAGDLPANHGFPLRAVVPGWYGMASVKWLTRIVVTDQPYHGFFQGLDYSIYERKQGLVTVTPLSRMQVKSLILSPTSSQRIAAKTEHRIHGVAWTGESEIKRVEVSTDGGRTWTAAPLLGKAEVHCLRHWELKWRSPEKSGQVTLMARATDALGNTQPMDRNTDRRTYMINHVQPVVVEVG